MMIHLALTLSQHSGRAFGATPDTGSVVLSLGCISRDRILFDLGAAGGRNTADIPLCGSSTAPEGSAIMAEIVHADTGAVVQAATRIATVGASGAWSGTRSAVPDTPHWLKARVWVEGSSAPKAETANRFGTGHVILLIGQSEDAMMFSLSDSSSAPGGMPAPVTVIDPEALQVVTSDEGVDASVATHLFITDATPLTASMTALSNVLAANAPGQKFMLIEAAHSGTSREQLATDAATGRSWADFLNTLDVAGTTPGLILDTWSAADRSTSFEAEFTPFYTGRNPDGSTYVLNTPEATTGTVFQRILFDLDPLNGDRGLFDPDRTRILFYGPHRYEITTGDLTNAITLAAGGQDAPLVAIQAVRTAMASMADTNPVFTPITVPYGPQVLAYSNGYVDAGGNLTDLTHPTRNSRDGMEKRARHTAHSALFGLDLVPRTVPAFDSSFWEPTGAYVDVWWSGGDIDTTRNLRGEGLPPNKATYPYRTQVLGFEITGEPAENAVLQANAGGSGRVGVRITPNGGGTFTFADLIQFGRGGGSGTYTRFDDVLDGLWKDYPIASTGLSEIEGVALRTMPDPAALANTLPAPVQFTVAGGTWFQDPALIPSGTTSIRFEVTGSFTVGSTMALATAFLGNHEIQILGNGRLRVFHTSNGVTATRDSASGTIQTGQTYTIASVVDYAAGTVQVFVDGVSAVSVTGLVGLAQMDPARRVFLLSKEAGQLPVTGTIQSAKVWFNDPTGAGTPHKTVEGNAATVNADPWKQGANAM